jgi:hypothetical protein
MEKFMLRKRRIIEQQHKLILYMGKGREGLVTQTQ